MRRVRTSISMAVGVVFSLATPGMALAGGLYPSAIGHGTAHALIWSAHGSVTLYDQNAHDTSSGLISQNYTAQDSDQFDSQGADDFKVPAGHTWKITEVDVTGNGSAASENVFFYKTKHGLPGKLVAACNSLGGKGNGSGSFAIKLPKSCPVKLKEGHYWVSVQANQLTDGGFFEWHWEENAMPKGTLAAWRNYGVGNPFGVCPSWGSDCFHHHTDFMFALKGVDTVQ